jgi:hypothetical protein
MFCDFNMLAVIFSTVAATGCLSSSSSYAGHHLPSLHLSHGRAAAERQREFNVLLATTVEQGEQVLNNLNLDYNTTHQGGGIRETFGHYDTRLRPGTSSCARSQPKSLEEQEEDVGILREEPHGHVPPNGPVTGVATIEGIVTIEVR